MNFRQVTDPGKAGSSAFYKGVLEWLICEMAARKEERDALRRIERIRYIDLLTRPESVAEQLQTANCPYRLDPGKAR